jgi:hypothetical protein
VFGGSLTTGRLSFTSVFRHSPLISLYEKRRFSYRFYNGGRRKISRGAEYVVSVLSVMLAVAVFDGGNTGLKLNLFAGMAIGAFVFYFAHMYLSYEIAFLLAFAIMISCI